LSQFYEIIVQVPILQTMPLDKRGKTRARAEGHVAPVLFQPLPEGYKWLNVTAGANGQ
jgi:hypothetical protein